MDQPSQVSTWWSPPPPTCARRQGGTEGELLHQHLSAGRRAITAIAGTTSIVVLSAAPPPLHSHSARRPTHLPAVADGGGAPLGAGALKGSGVAVDLGGRGALRHRGAMGGGGGGWGGGGGGDLEGGARVHRVGSSRVLHDSAQCGWAARGDAGQTAQLCQRPVAPPKHSAPPLRPTSEALASAFSAFSHPPTHPPTHASTHPAPPTSLRRRRCSRTKPIRASMRCRWGSQNLPGGGGRGQQGEGGGGAAQRSCT